MKKIFLSLLWAVSSLGMAQNVFKGTLVNAEQQGVSGANILLISLPDSPLVKGAYQDYAFGI